MKYKTLINVPSYMVKTPLPERRMIQAAARAIQLEAEKETICSGYILEKIQAILNRLPEHFYKVSIDNMN